MQFALSQVQGRLAALRSSLPAELELSAERLTPSVFPMLQYELTGADPLVLRDLAEFTVRPRLAGLPDVGEVEVQGGRIREISVQLDPAPPGRRATSVVDEVAQRDRRHRPGRGRRAGSDRDYRQYAIVVSGLTNTPEAVGQVVVRADGDRAGAGGRPRHGELRRGGPLPDRDGQRPPGRAGQRRPPAERQYPRACRRRSQAAIDSIRPLLRPGVRLESVYDQAALVRDSMRERPRRHAHRRRFSRCWCCCSSSANGGPPLAAALSLPLTVAITLLGLALTGDSLNLMCLGGLAVAIGIIIDDAVVVVENIERRLAIASRDEPPAEVIRRGTDEIFGPVAGSTLTTVVVFAPLGLLSGRRGRVLPVVRHRARDRGAALAGARHDPDPDAGRAVGHPPGTASAGHATDGTFPASGSIGSRSATRRAIGWMLEHRGVALGGRRSPCCSVRSGPRPESWAPGSSPRWTKAGSSSTTGRRLAAR